MGLNVLIRKINSNVFALLALLEKHVLYVSKEFLLTLFGFPEFIVIILKFIFFLIIPIFKWKFCIDEKSIIFSFW